MRKNYIFFLSSLLLLAIGGCKSDLDKESVIPSTLSAKNEKLGISLPEVETAFPTIEPDVIVLKSGLMVEKRGTSTSGREI